MPAIFGIILIIGLVYLLFAMIIPTIASTIAATMIGKKAKLTFDQTSALAFYYYFITGGFVGGTVMKQSPGEGLWANIFDFFMGFFLWPLPASFMIFGAMKDGWFEILSCLIAGFAITQMIAVIMILKRAKIDTDVV